MTAPKFQAGSRVLATDVNGIEHAATVLSSMESTGHSFPVVWLKFDDGSWDRVPWPAESVRLASSALVLDPVTPKTATASSALLAVNGGARSFSRGAPASSSPDRLPRGRGLDVAPPIERRTA